jgi:hypothetical protein
MTRLRFTLAQLMAVVLLVGFGFAAQWNATEFWASATYTLAILVIATATVGALPLRGRARTTWTGLAVFGWIYLLVGLLPPWNTDPIYHTQLVRPPLLIEWCMVNVHVYLKPAGGFNSHEAKQVSHSLAIIVFGLGGAVLARLLAAKEERLNP